MNELEKYAEGVIPVLEEGLERDLTSLEKIAVLGAVVKYGPRALKATYDFTLGPLLSRKRATQWGKSITDSYKGSRGSKPYERFRSTFSAAAKTDPLLTAGAVGGAGYAGAKMTSKVNSGPQSMQPMPVYAMLNEITEELEKTAEKKDGKKSTPLNPAWTAAGIGAAVGIGLSARVKGLKWKQKHNERLEYTKPIREWGKRNEKEITSLDEQFKKQREDVFKTIQDPVRRKDIDNLSKKLAEDWKKLSSKLDKGVRQQRKQVEHAKIDQMYNEKLYTKEVADFMHKELDKVWRY